MTEEYLKKMLNDKMGGKTNFNPDYHSEVIKELYFNRDVATATPSQIELVKQVRTALMTQDNIYLSEQVIFRSLLELEYKGVYKLTASGLYTFILGTYKLFSFVKPKEAAPAPKAKPKDEFVVFEELCQSDKVAAKTEFYRLSKKYYDTPELVKVNNIKNKYW